MMGNMKRWQKILLWVVGIIALFWGGHAITYPTTTFNYRLTVEAMTPDGPKTGSGVIQVSYGSQCCVPGFGTRGKTSVTGEAVYLDLGQGKNLFVTLVRNGTGRKKSPGTDDNVFSSAASLPEKVYNFKWDWGDEFKLAEQVTEAKRTGPKDVPLIALPATVTFLDLTDPMTVKLIDPQNIAETFGDNYALTKATLELTDAQHTEGIVRALSWMSRIDGGYLSGGPTSRGSPYGLSGLAFKSEGLSP
jgi:hypothetical protein